MVETKYKIFKDAVHGYIDIPVAYVENIIDSIYFQRLRNIEQTGMRVLFPAAKHDRFSHSLGVFYLGQKAVNALKNNNYLVVANGNIEKYKVLFLTACLLHDIGHTPFSHSLEDQVLANSKIGTEGRRRKKDEQNGVPLTNKLLERINAFEKAFCEENSLPYDPITEIKAAAHEQIGAYLIIDKLNDRVIRLEEECNLYSDGKPTETVTNDDLCFIARMIMGIKYTEYSVDRQIRNCFIELLNGDNFDVDKLDYIVRDTYMSGIKNVSIDVERLLSSLCVVTKTKHLNVENIDLTISRDLTVSEIKNNGVLNIDGECKGILEISKGAKVVLQKDSIIELLRGKEQEAAEIQYADGDEAMFSNTSDVQQDNEWINACKTDQYKGDVKKMPGKPNQGLFCAYIENAETLSPFKFRTKNNVIIQLHGKCKITIEGGFKSVGAIKLSKGVQLKGSISETEVIGDSLKDKLFSQDDHPDKNNYNTFSIGFKKQAINVIANVLEARNYLYLWVYAHHKVVYYTNFLIPVITQNIAKYFGSGTGFPLWKLDYQNIEFLDDYYIWTTMKYLCETEQVPKLSKTTKTLMEQLFSRNYDESLYKSLAEYDLMFASFTAEQKDKIFDKMKAFVDKSKPYLKDKHGKYLVGYLKQNGISDINSKISENATNEMSSFKIQSILFVVTEFKQKRLDPNKVLLDMQDEILPISQIQLLSDNHIEVAANKGKYFYLYYSVENEQLKLTKQQMQLLKESIKDYFRGYIK